MDYTTSAWPDPSPAPPAPPEHHHPCFPAAPPPPEYHYHSHHYAAPNPSPAAAAASSSSYYYANPSPNPTAYEPYGSYPSYAAHHGGYSFGSGAAAPPTASVGGVAGYYYGNVAGDGAAAAGKEAIRQYGFDPQLYAQAVAARSSNGVAAPVPASGMHSQWNTHYAYPLGRNAMRKRIKKKTRVVQSAFCEVCKIDCTTPDVLKAHKQGKKHKKNLEKLQEAITAKPLPKPPTSTVGENKEAPAADKGKAIGERSKKKSAVSTPEELEVKKQRVLEAGAAEEEVRICTVCNVVVNNQKVYEFHIAGQKHKAMVEKQREQKGA